MSAWNWDARPFPAFPLLGSVWGDAANWPSGNWLGGKGPFIAPQVPDPPPVPPGTYPTFPALAGQGWSAKYTPVFATMTASHVSGRESRAARRSSVRWQVELSFDVLRMDAVDRAAGARRLLRCRARAWRRHSCSNGAGRARAGRDACSAGSPTTPRTWRSS